MRDWDSCASATKRWIPARVVSSPTASTRGRSADTWVDFDFYGHQVVAHLSPDECRPAATGQVDGDAVPVRHFGTILPMAEWEALAARLRAAGTRFIIEPHVRFKGEVGEQATMFFLDPSGNALEFKSCADRSQVFAK